MRERVLLRETDTPVSLLTRLQSSPQLPSSRARRDARRTTPSSHVGRRARRQLTTRTSSSAANNAKYTSGQNVSFFTAQR